MLFKQGLEEHFDKFTESKIKTFLNQGTVCNVLHVNFY